MKFINSFFEIPESDIFLDTLLSKLLDPPLQNPYFILISKYFNLL